MLNKMNTLFHKGIANTKKHAPIICTVVGIVGFGVTVSLAVKSTPKASKIIEAEKKKANEEERDVDKKALIRMVAPLYIPALAAGILSTAIILNGNYILNKRNVAITAAYQISSNTLKDYKDSVKEKLGDETSKEITKHVAEKRIEKNPIRKELIESAEGGDTLFFDAFTGRYFTSDENAIKAAMNKINHDKLAQNYSPLNDFYYELGLDESVIGENMGWNADDGIIEVELYSTKKAPNGEPCILMTFSKEPTYYAYGYEG